MLPTLNRRSMDTCWDTLIRGRDPLGGHPTINKINPLGRQFRAPVKPPSQHRHVGANDILDDEFARNGGRGFLVNGCLKFVADQIGEYLANDTKGDGAAADEPSMEVNMVAGVFEQGQTETQASVPDISRSCQNVPLPIDEHPAQVLEAAPH